MKNLRDIILEHRTDLLLDISLTKELVNKNFEYKGFHLTPLLLSVITEDFQICDILIKNGADVNSRDKIIDPNDLTYVEDGVYAIHHACSKGNLEIVKLLIENGANPNQETSLGQTPFLYSVQTNNLDLIKYLTPRTNDINKTISTGYNAICLAIDAYVDYNVIEHLVTLGIDVNNIGAGKWTPLLSSIAKERYDIAKLLITNGADVNAKTEAGWDIYYLSKDKIELLKIIE